MMADFNLALGDTDSFYTLTMLTLSRLFNEFAKLNRLSLMICKSKRKFLFFRAVSFKYINLR